MQWTYLSMLLGSVPPIEEQMTTCVSGPHAFAASICDFCPSQSTISGDPLGKEKTGLPESGSVSPVGAGLAEVPMMRALQPLMADAKAAASVTSATTTHSDGTPVSSSAERDCSVRTTPIGENWSGIAKSLRNACWPVCAITYNNGNQRGSEQSNNKRIRMHVISCGAIPGLPRLSRRRGWGPRGPRRPEKSAAA